MQAGSQVIVCGRRADKRAGAQQLHPALLTRVCDVADAAELVRWVTLPNRTSGFAS